VVHQYPQADGATSRRNAIVEEIVAICQVVTRGLCRGECESEIRSRIANRVGGLGNPERGLLVDEMLSLGIRRCVIDRIVGAQDRAVGEQEQQVQRLAEWHPVSTLFRENTAIVALVAEITPVLSAFVPRDSHLDQSDLGPLRRLVEAHSDLERHYRRVQDLFLPHLERRGSNGLSWILWAYQSGVRDRLRALRQVLKGEIRGWSRRLLKASAVAAIKSIKISIQKEESILCPILLGVLGNEDWLNISRDSQEIGWCLVRPITRPDAERRVPSDSVKFSSQSTQSVFDSPGGGLSHKELSRVLIALPFDLTFVDVNDRVRFFTEGPGRVFPRSRSIVGRSVLRCHAPKSVKTVTRILEDFRAGTQDVAEFWMQLGERFIHVQYLAIRAIDGHYVGTLEVSQDATRIRALEGEKRTLEYS